MSMADILPRALPPRAPRKSIKACMFLTFGLHSVVLDVSCAIDGISKNGHLHAVTVTRAPTSNVGISNDIGLRRLRIHSGVSLQDF